MNMIYVLWYKTAHSLSRLLSYSITYSITHSLMHSINQSITHSALNEIIIGLNVWMIFRLSTATDD